MRTARRWAPWLLLVAAAVTVLIIGTHRSSNPSLDTRVMQIAGEVRCPVCDGETAAQSSAAASVQIRAQIKTDLEGGESSSQILASLVKAYGSGILEKPPAKGVDLIVWVGPIVGFAAAAGGLGFAFYRWRRRAPVGETSEDEPDAADEVGRAGEPAVTVEPVEPVETQPEEALEPVLAVEPDLAAEPVGRPVAALAPGLKWKRRIVAGVGVALIAGGAGWAVAASTSTRLPGEPITGQALGNDAVAQDLQQAQTDAANGNVLDAVKEYQKILASDPTQPDALTGEGWTLAETGEPSLLQQGLSLLASAEKTNPTYAPAHVYRGIALLSEDDYADAIPELQWYLDHDPDPTLVPQVKQALDQAEQGAKAASASHPS